MSGGISYQSIKSKAFFLYDNEEICKWIETIGLNSYKDNFVSNKISGVDLCYLTNEDIKENLKISCIHDRFSLIREIKKVMNIKIKFCLYFNEDKIDLFLDFDLTITLEKIFPLICNVLNLNKVKKITLNIKTFQFFIRFYGKKS